MDCAERRLACGCKCNAYRSLRRNGSRADDFGRWLFRQGYGRRIDDGLLRRGEAHCHGVRRLECLAHDQRQCGRGWRYAQVRAGRCADDRGVCRYLLHACVDRQWCRADLTVRVDDNRCRRHGFCHGDA